MKKVCLLFLLGPFVCADVKAEELENRAAVKPNNSIHSIGQTINKSSANKSLSNLLQDNGVGSFDELKNKLIGQSSDVIIKSMGQPHIRILSVREWDESKFLGCSWIYFCGDKDSSPLRLVLNDDKCTSVQSLSRGQLHHLYTQRIRNLAKSRGKTLSEIILIEPFPNSFLDEQSGLTVSYRLSSENYCVLKFEKGVCQSVEMNVLVGPGDAKKSSLK